MKREESLHLRCILNVCLGLALLIFAAVTVVLADGWKANDDGNDNPDGQTKWFAPSSVIHRMEWWDVDQAGAMDQVRDYQLYWNDMAQENFNTDQSKNLCHEVRTGRDYEAQDWYWTDLPTPDLVETSWEIEEQYDNYDEVELCWDRPYEQIPEQSDRQVYTGYRPYNDGSNYFESEAELTYCEVIQWDPYVEDCWRPYDWDVLGRMEVSGMN